MASSLLNILASIPLILGGHELGHFKAGREANVPMTLVDNGFFAHTDNSDKLAKVFGGGFEGQDLAVALGKDLGIDDKTARAVSGLNKLGYAFVPDGLTPKVAGDVSLMGREKGKTAKKVMQGALIISAISDLLKASGKGLGPDKDLKFVTTDTGAPGLMFEKRF